MIAAITPASMLRPVALLPDDLSYDEKRALRMVHDFRMVRRPKGWRGGAGGRISLAMAAKLAGMGLLRTSYAGRDPQLELTGKGRDFHLVIESRKERRRA